MKILLCTVYPMELNIKIKKLANAFYHPSPSQVLVTRTINRGKLLKCYKGLWLWDLHLTFHSSIYSSQTVLNLLPNIISLLLGWLYISRSDKLDINDDLVVKSIFNTNNHHLLFKWSGLCALVIKELITLPFYVDIF